MSYSIALWIRDTALRLQKDKNDLQWAMMNQILDKNGNVDHSVGFQKGKPGYPKEDPYKWDPTGKEKEDLTWLLK